MKHSTLSNSYKDGDLKSVDVFTKVISLQCSQIKRVHDGNFHEWKIIPSYLMKIIFFEKFKFQPCLDRGIRSLKKVPHFQQEMITNWPELFSFITISDSFPSFYGLTRILKLAIRAFLSLNLRVKTSLLLVRLFTKMARLNHWVISNQNTALKAC